MAKREHDIYIHGSDPVEQERLSLLNAILNEACIEVINVQPHERIMDVGSGLGNFTRHLARSGGNPNHTVGVERDPEQLKAAIALAQKDSEQHLIDFRRGEAYSLPLAEEEAGLFDLVHCRFVLEHLKDPQKAVDQMARAVAPGGRIFLIDDDHSLFRLHPDADKVSKLWRAYCASYEVIGNDPWIGRKLVSLLQSAGSRKIRQGTLFFGSWNGDLRWKMYIDNIKGILTGAKQLMIRENLTSESAFEEGISEIETWSNSPDAAIWYPLNWAEGIMPGGNQTN